MDRDDLIASLIRLAHAPGDAHRSALVARGARADHAQPAAREWVRRWGPTRVVMAPPACACATGRCAVCN